MPVVSVGFIGSGRLAERVARDLIKNVAPQRKFNYTKQRLVSTLLASDPSEERRRVFHRLGFRTTGTSQEVLADCDLVFLGTNKIREALAASATNAHTLYVSLMGDLSALQVEELLCPRAKVIRMMPQGDLEKAGVPKGILPLHSWATVYGSHVNDQDVEKVMRIAGIDKSVKVDENATSWAFPSPTKQGPSLIYRFSSHKSDSVAETALEIDNFHTKSNTIVANFNDLYELGSQLGGGKFSTVFKGFCRLTGELVAVKVAKGTAQSHEGEDELVAEMGALNRLKNPNIISQNGFFNEKGKLLLVLEYCDRGSVRHMMDTEKVVSEKLAKEILKQVLSALQYCHFQGHVHRDIKADNVLLKTNNDGLLVAKVADFGLSEELQLANRRRENMCGTPQYLSPEVVAGRLYGTPADIWSTGILAYMMLTGLVPFGEAKHEIELLKLISLGAVWYDQPQWNNVSPAAKRFVQSMLDISPDSRPTAAELLKHEWLHDA
ncbi:hypothetical protein CCR75_000739 [Bremia lactucae]|uniref:Protein kinase domain-containing protein n=1 Tax=Bremia lactucae TaxID=4779 RepID=A0A976III4_BRELC|nr:hypothetical protein CCR75_000739 [Bremia lactucae]